MRIIIEAVFFYVLMFGMSYWTLSYLNRDLRSHFAIQRIIRKREEKMGVMDRILILEGIAILLYVIADFYVFWHVGSEPSALTAGFFAVCGGENGMMAWIRVRKQEERMRKWQLEEQEKEPGKEDDTL